MDRLIEIKINGSHLTKDNLYAGVQGEANVTALRIEFDESWDGYMKTVVFWDAKGENPVKRILNADMLEDAANSRIYRCMIPAEPLAEAGECTIIVDGYVEGKRPRTIPVKLKVRPAPDSENAAAPTDPTPSQAEHLQEQIDTLEEKFEGVVEAIENIPEGTATPIVNNLVTGGTTMALSAEMGKVLKQELDGRANTNLLDNWYFANPVNQRGQAEYTAEGYTIDRWKKNPNGKLIIASDGITLNAVGVSANTIVDSPIEYDLIGKQITVSALTAEGQLLANTDIPTDTTAATVFAYLDIGGKGLAGLVVNGAEKFMRIRANPGNSISIVAVKLELGTQQTLARKDAAGKWVLNELPNYHEQLLRCSVSRADKNDTYANKVIIHTGNMAQYIGVAQASLEE